MGNVRRIMRRDVRVDVDNKVLRKFLELKPEEVIVAVNLYHGRKKGGDAFHSFRIENTNDDMVE